MSEEAIGGMADNITTEEGAGTEALTDGIADDPKADEPIGGIADDEPGEADRGKPAPDAEQAKEGGEKEPEAYELTVSEDFPLPEGNLQSFSAACRDAGLTREQAEKILGWHKEQYEASKTFSDQAEKRILDDWEKEILTDKEFGGENYRATVADARRAFQMFDPDGELRAFLRESKYQFNPTVIRAVARVGRAMGEHGFVGRTGEGKEEKPLEERMYPDMKF